jgi:phosphoribosylglycinamide formyltransferase 2
MDLKNQYADAGDRIVAKHQPDFIVPEIEAIRTERLRLRKTRNHSSFCESSFTMNRQTIRDLAAKELGLKTANYRYATTAEEA